MSLTKCADCGKLLVSKTAARKHYQEYHSGEIETPEEELPDHNSEQQDFHGEQPTTEGHEPRYMTENEPAGEGTRPYTLHEFEREKDGSIPEFNGDYNEE